jgi:hypothetical protein
MWSAFLLGVLAMTALGVALTLSASGGVSWVSWSVFVVSGALALALTARVTRRNRLSGTGHHMFR